jgi:hypothetical protein
MSGPHLTLLTQELNPCAERYLPRLLLGMLTFKGLTARRLYKSFSFKGLMRQTRGQKKMLTVNCQLK